VQATIRMRNSTTITGFATPQVPWRPPLKMQVAHERRTRRLSERRVRLFWNDPFTLTGGINALREAVWFFYASPPSNMALVPGVPAGWKAAIVPCSAR